MWQPACECHDGYTGFDCSLLACPEDCLGRGYCYNGTCHCYPGYAGKSCALLACPNDCSRHGTCKAGTCECLAGWGGDDCSERICLHNCSGHGVCAVGHICLCDDGWAGAWHSGMEPPTALPAPVSHPPPAPVPVSVAAPLPPDSATHLLTTSSPASHVLPQAMRAMSGPARGNASTEGCATTARATVCQDGTVHAVTCRRASPAAALTARALTVHARATMVGLEPRVLSRSARATALCTASFRPAPRHALRAKLHPHPRLAPK